MSRRDRALYAEVRIVVVLAVLGLLALAALTGPGCSSPTADVERYPFQGPWLDPEGRVVDPPSYVLGPEKTGEQEGREGREGVAP